MKKNRLTQAEKNKMKELEARRKLNECWRRIEKSGKYRKAEAMNICMNTTDKIASEVLDGILLKLNERNNGKSSSEQKRLLRRIVEKRQAQAMHRCRQGRDRKSAVAVIRNTGKCMEQLHRIRFVC